MSEKKQTHININVKSTFQYLKLLSTLFNLTMSERQLLAVIIDLTHKEINPFSTEGRKMITITMNFKSPNTINVYVKNLKEKKALIKTPYSYIVNPMLMPVDQLTVNFNWNA